MQFQLTSPIPTAGNDKDLMAATGVELRAHPFLLRPWIGPPPGGMDGLKMDVGMFLDFVVYGNADGHHFCQISATF